MKPYRKQFLIGNQPRHVHNDWKTIPLGENQFISHCPELLTSGAVDKEGTFWYLLGIAVQTDENRKDPLSEITCSTTAQVRELYRSWAGRWVLVGAGEIHMDCSGLLGCFYTTVNGVQWASSSLALLQQLGNFTPRAELLTHKIGLEWYPLPFSRFEGISKLLPSQVLHFKTAYVSTRAVPTPITGLPYEEVISALEIKLKHAMANVAHSYERIFAQLTSGYDSRLVLAILHSLGMKAETYTTESSYISHGDATLPFKLAKMAGYRHQYIKRQSYSKEKEALYDLHTARNSVDIDRTKFSEGQWDAFGKGDLILRGGIFEAGRCPYIWKQTGPEFTIESILRGVQMPCNLESFPAKAYAEWMNWVENTPMPGLDWRDRFYLEQRVGGWLSGIEQSLDLTGTERFSVANSHDLISLLLTVPLEKRKGKIYYIDLIRRMCPALLNYPFNPPDPKFIRMQKKAIRLSKMPLHQVYQNLKGKLVK